MDLFQIFWVWVKSLFGYYPRNHKVEWEMGQFRQREAARKESHRSKIAAAVHILTGSSWRDPAGKAEFIAQV